MGFMHREVLLGIIYDYVSGRSDISHDVAKFYKFFDNLSK